MEEEKDERILNLLRLKMELEKDLQKKGARPKEQPPKKDIPPVKPKIVFEEELKVPVEDIWSIYDLNYFTYGEDDSLIQRSIHKKIGQIDDRVHQIFLEQLESLIAGDFAKRHSAEQKNAYFEALDLTRMLYETCKVPAEALKRSLKEYPSSPVVLLSVAEVLLFAGKSREAGMLFKSAAGSLKNPYVELLAEAYDTGQVNPTLFANCVSQGGYKLLVLLVSALTEDEERAIKIADILQRRSYTCAKYAACKVKVSKNDEYTFCPRLLILNRAIDYVNKGSFDRKLIETLSNFDPQAHILLLSEAVNKKDYKGTESYLSKLIDSSGPVMLVPTSRTNRPVCLKGVIGQYVSSKSFVSVSDPKEGAKRLLEMIDQFGDVQIVFKDMEFLRLFYGERHCKNLYGRA